MLIYKTLLEICDNIDQSFSQLLKTMNMMPTATILEHPSKIYIYICFAKKGTRRLRNIFSAARGLPYFSNVRGPASLKIAMRQRAQNYCTTRTLLWYLEKGQLIGIGNRHNRSFSIEGACWDLRHSPCASWLVVRNRRGLWPHLLCVPLEEVQKLSLDCLSGSHFEIHNNNKPFFQCHSNRASGELHRSRIITAKQAEL